MMNMRMLLPKQNNKSVTLNLSIRWQNLLGCVLFDERYSLSDS